MGQFRGRVRQVVVRGAARLSLREIVSGQREADLDVVEVGLVFL
ncbi:hypothetical protein ACFXPI_05075 [Streptomyces sp. NPDC059104]